MASSSTLYNDVVEVEKLLNELFGGKIDIGQIVDYIIRLRAGQSFASNPKNKRLEAGLEKVLLRETLLVLMYMWGRLPGRGPEMTILWHCDSCNNGRKVVRFVPDGIRRIVVAIYRIASSDREDATAGMSAQRAGWRRSLVWETNRLRKKLTRVIQTGTGVRLGLEGKMEDEDEDNNVEIDLIIGEPIDCRGS
ncbi:hypothetical protein V8F33_014240 [Rhypophila sp. PSN 637]